MSYVLMRPRLYSDIFYTVSHRHICLKHFSFDPSRSRPPEIFAKSIKRTRMSHPLINEFDIFTNCVPKPQRYFQFSIRNRQIYFALSLK